MTIRGLTHEACLSCGHPEFYHSMCTGFGAPVCHYAFSSCFTVTDYGHEQAVCNCTGYREAEIDSN